MPKRSNEFQVLIHYIYSSIVADGGSVTESAMVKENGTSIEREVDVLVEQTIATHIIRIGVECRKHARTSDIQWIDALIGKYRDLPIHKVIAVNSKGFSKSAIEKAKKNNIETLTLEEATNLKWEDEFKQLFLVISEVKTVMNSVEVLSEENIQLSDSSIFENITYLNGKNVGPFRPFILEFYKQNVQKKARDDILKNFKNILNKTDSVLNATAPVYIGFNDCYMKLNDEKKIKINKVTFTVNVERKILNLKDQTKRYLFNKDVLLSTTKAKTSDGKLFDIKFVQTKNKDDFKLTAKPLLKRKKNVANG